MSSSKFNTGISILTWSYLLLNYKLCLSLINKILFKLKTKLFFYLFSMKIYKFAAKLYKFRFMANINRLKVVLVEQGKTGKWLAEQLGKSTCTVSKWCQNINQPDLQTLDAISKLLNVSIRDLLLDNKEVNQ